MIGFINDMAADSPVGTNSPLNDHNTSNSIVDKGVSQDNPSIILKELRLKNINRLIIDQLY